MNYIYIFRHAESEDNRQHLFSGWRNPELSEKGRIDCQELAQLLRDKEIDIFFSPNLKRNLETVVEVRKYHPQSKVELDERIRERRYGDLQGQRHLELMKEDLNTYLLYHRSYDVPPPGGESIRMVEERVKPFFDELNRRVRDMKINAAVCAGNNAMRVLRRFLENLTVEEMMRIENPYDNYFEYSID
ncbi:MAG: histidine phosphatase family protein [Patescibacteria group bacterium]|nr:histidine phosphatase family protein [Patescibacteria group bacterium]